MNEKIQHYISSDIQNIIDNYGYYSSAMLLFKYIFLIRALRENKELDPTKNTDVISTYESLRDHFQKIINEPSPHQDHITEIEINNSYYLRYNPDVFVKDYPDFHKVIQQRVCFYKNCEINDAAFYIYSINTQRQILIDNRPIPTSEIFYRKGQQKISHAHLVANFDLTAACAGEVVFVKQGQKIRYAIINNRSGHFLPQERHLQLAKDIFANNLNVPTEHIFDLCMMRR